MIMYQCLYAVFITHLDYPKFSCISGLAEGLQGDIVSLNGYATICSLNVGFDVAESLTRKFNY